VSQTTLFAPFGDLGGRLELHDALARLPERLEEGVVIPLR